MFCPTSFKRECSSFLGAWCPPPVFRNCSVEVAQHSNAILINMWGRNCSLHPISQPFWDHPTPQICIFSTELVLYIRRSQYWSFNFSISPSNKYSELILFRSDWFDLPAVQGTLKSLLQHYSSKASFFGAQPSLGSNSHIRTWLKEKYMDLFQQSDVSAFLVHCLYLS